MLSVAGGLIIGSLGTIIIISQTQHVLTEEEYKEYNTLNDKKNLKGVSFKKEGDHTLVNIDLKEGVQIIRINASSLNILYTQDGKIWTANVKR